MQGAFEALFEFARQPDFAGQRQFEWKLFICWRRKSIYMRLIQVERIGYTLDFDQSNGGAKPAPIWVAALSAARVRSGVVKGTTRSSSAS